ncbi:MAG: two-component system, OmpR family, phosphate regulon sensor histidine kinase PhoR [Gaiellaceae bacterium]|nr:two-component system, OmpR family, phosphate regulon sensor histidine kinase PhoR [Gaiellaceae bacterium]
MNRRSLESWISVVRLLGVLFAVLQVSLTSGYPSGYAAAAWTLTVVLAIGAVALYLTAREDRPYRVVAMLFDFTIVSCFAVLYAFELGTPTRQLLYLAIVVGAARFGMRGGVAVALAAIPVAALFEQRRAHWLHAGYRVEFVTFQAGAGLLMALLVGWVVARRDDERENAERRAAEAEALRDELGRRADLLDAANRCARALNSSLDLDEAFSAFIRELRGLVPFDRVAIVLAEEGSARIIATAGEQSDGSMASGAEFSVENSLISDVMARGQTVYRRDMSRPEYVEEERLLELGLHSRVAAPLLAGARTIGLISLGRRERDAFQEHEIELASLLGRLAASAVQNIRAYESERRTVEELRSLSALRADFVSLVSHELRSPMAAVIGAARTLQARWRELQPGQRESFLALIGDETTRLAALIGDVLDTSRIDAGTFSYRFTDVDIAALVRDMVATAALGQDEIPVLAEIAPGVSSIRGDAERLRQIFANLIDNAVKYSPAGETVEVRVSHANGAVLVSVRDRGPGIKTEDQRLIFEKFGRASGAPSKPGSGLGLYIARSIAETHGGTIAVASSPGRGATFTVKLPA